MTTRVLPTTHHRTTKIDGVNIFYREAGPADAPVVARYSFLHNIANLSRIVVHGDLVSCDVGMTITVAVMPAASVIWRGTLSIFIRTRAPHPV